ncbi:Clathrin coat assembly protein AP180 [Anabarilius grahami]|uniref:Clathrin coat assembly protein AP180 n=1 Tax=Anabarilius grahami TaxID=495550 RepID=A0A3N0Z2D9_ANAGA|nr:Clathrin coat assembly protein AP180 [Anabarilius grahami]
MSGQTLTDRIAAAQYQLTGSDVARAVCKATTHEVMAPKKKHLDCERGGGEVVMETEVDYWERGRDLISATNETNVNIPQMADTLFERSTNASWVVVFKALTTTHHICIYGNERFIQYLASRTSLFNLSNFIDKTGSHGYDMSTFIRRFARYLNEKAYAYRAMAFDFTRVKKGAEGVMRTMAPDKLLKAMPALQTQVDTLLEFDVHPKDLNNGIINAAFLLLFKDLIKLFASYNDGIINLLEKYFKMKKSECKDSLEIYKKFLTRVTKIAEFMKIAEQVGVDKNDIPDISYCLHPRVVADLADSDNEDCPFKDCRNEEPAPSSILESLETHMNSLEGKKGSPTKGSPTNNVSPTSTPAKSAAAVPTLEPPRTEAAPAAETATDSLLDLDPLSSSGPSAGGASAAPTSWGEIGSLTTETLLPDPTLAVDSNSSATPTTTATEAAVSLAPPPSAAGASSGSADLLGDMFAAPAAETAAAAEGGATAATPTPAADGTAATDPFAPTAGSADNSLQLDLFSLQPVDDSNALFSSVAPTNGQAPVSTSTSDVAPTASPAPTIDLFAGFFDPMPDSSVPKSDPNPSLDLFSADVNKTRSCAPDVFRPPAAALSAPMSWPDSAANLDLFGESAGAGEAKPAAPAAASAGGDLMSAFDGLGDMLMPAMAPQATGASSPVKPMGGGDLDSAMANMASNLGVGNQKPGESAGGANWQAQVPTPSWGVTMMSPGMAQSPRKPPPSKDPLADLSIKDFM